MDSLYREDRRYTKEADAFDQAVFAVVAPLFRAWVKLGYSPRELSHIAQGTITEMELDAVLLSLEKYREVYENQYVGILQGAMQK